LFSSLFIRFEIDLAVISLAGNGRKISFPDSPESQASERVFDLHAAVNNGHGVQI
jgi:hypothetical protein